VGQDSRARLAVFMATRLLDAVEERFASSFDLTRAAGDQPLDELAASDSKFDAIVFSLDVAMRKEQIESLPKSVRALATYSVGTDHVDLEVAEKRGLAVFNTPGVLADSVAENALLLMLGAARRATESLNLIRSRAWSGWSPRQLVGLQLSGRTLGILGMGDIGLRIATRAEALGMKILYCNRRRPAPSDPRAAGFRATAGELVKESDILLLACPSTDETRGIVDAALLEDAKPELILVNIARGDLVEDKALIDALREGRVWAAGLDVFAGEPDLNPAYYDLPNVFMLPHVGSSTLEARMGMGQVLIDAISDWQIGRSVANRVC
jgi:lactate dehydrogenase-like 2-hydroxyacid dehydrogenase